MDEIDIEDDDLFGEDVIFSQESVEKRLGKVQKRGKLPKSAATNKSKQEKDKALGSKNDEQYPGEKDDPDYKEPISRNRLKKVRSSGREEPREKEAGASGGEVSEVITVEDDETEKNVIRLNIKVYKRKASEIIIIKTLAVALYRADPVKKLVTYISKNLSPKLANYMDDIKVYFDGDHVDKEMQIKEIGIDDEEQLEIKVPFECIWS